MIALITGITGQDGSYLAEFLLEKGYEVVGIERRSSTDTHLYRIKHILDNPNLKVVWGDVTDQGNMFDLVQEYQPDEFYNLAAQSHVKVSFEQPILTWNVNAGGVLNILEAIRKHSPFTRLYQASTSEMFGRSYSGHIDIDEFTVLQHFNKDSYPIERFKRDYPFSKPFQSEETPFEPQSPYSVAKSAAHYAVQLYRRSYGLHASCGILFNHESERRGELFVTRKITKWIGKNMVSAQPKLKLGSIDSKRDWGHARDYVEAMWIMLQEDEPDDYVVSTQETHSVREFLQVAFEYVGINNYIEHIEIDPEFIRPAEVSYLLGDSSKFRNKFNWEPSISFTDLVHRMVANDIYQEKKNNN